MPEEADKIYMKRALRLAQRARGKTAPNPMVGAVVVKDGTVVGEGFHPRAGAPHAEVLALAEAGEQARGATLYTNLEPCCHTDKRTPPCTDAILKSGLRRVVAAAADPNPKVAGRGLALLGRAGIEVAEGLLRHEAERLNEVFIKYVTTGRPFVILKAAITLDGRIATAKGASRWISGEAARREVHRLRSEVDAVLVGIGTVLADDPLLTARRRGRKNPLRVVIDPDLKMPLQSRVVASISEAPVLAVTTSRAALAKSARLERSGVDVLRLPHRKGMISLPLLFERLGERGIASVLIEGGGVVNGAALRAGAVDKVIFYIAPKLLAGDDARSVVSGKAFSSLEDAILLGGMSVRKIGDDLRVEGYPQKRERGGGA